MMAKPGISHQSHLHLQGAAGGSPLEGNNPTTIRSTRRVALSQSGRTWSIYLLKLPSLQSQNVSWSGSAVELWAHVSIQRRPCGTSLLRSTSVEDLLKVSQIEYGLWSITGTSFITDYCARHDGLMVSVLDSDPDVRFQSKLESLCCVIGQEALLSRCSLLLFRLLKMKYL